MIRTALRSTLVLALSLLASVQAHAQTQSLEGLFTEPGLNVDHAYASDFEFEKLDTLTGSLVLVFTDIALPANNGKSLVFQHTYSSANQTSGQWSVGLAGMPKSIRAWEYGNSNPKVYYPSLVMTDGAVRALYPEPGQGSAPRYWISSEFWRYDTLDRVLQLPDGTRLEYDRDPESVDPPDGLGPTSHHASLSEIRDAFNNVTSITGGTNTTITQHLATGEQRQVVYTRSGTTETVQFGTKVWTYRYENLSYPNHVTSIQPPMGPAWQFTYGPAVPGAPGIALKGVTVPSGGTIEYGYTQTARPTGLPGASFSIYPVTSRTLKERNGVSLGTWTYTYDDAQGTGTTGQTVVVSPDGVRETLTHAMQGSGPYNRRFMLTQRVRVAVAAPHIELERETRTYITDGAAIDLAPALQDTTLVREGLTYRTEYVYRQDSRYGDYRHPWKIIERGQVGTLDELTRTTERTYDYFGTRWVHGLVQREETRVDPGAETHVVVNTYALDTAFLTSRTVDNVRTDYTPDLGGNLGTSRNARQHTTVFTHHYGVPKSMTTPQNVTISRVINPDGTIQSETRGGRTTSYEYDALARVIRKTPPIGADTTVAYDNLAATRATVSRGALRNTTHFDGFGRPVGTRQWTSDNATANIVTRTQYDALGRVVYNSLPYDGLELDGLPALPNLPLGTRTTYDGLGRVTQQKHADETFVATVYNGATTTVTNERGKITTHRWQAFGDPAVRRLRSVTDAANSVWNYTYNGLGQITQASGPDGMTRVWRYDPHGWLLDFTQPASGKTEFGHDVIGNVTSRKDAKSTNFTLVYDNDNRLTSEAGGGQTTRTGYEPGTNNRASQSIDGGVVNTTTYDGANRLETSTDTIRGRSFVTRYDYDERDNLTKVTYPSGRVIVYEYDQADRVIKVREDKPGGGTVYYVTAVTYHPSGAIKSYTFGNGRTQTFNYHPTRYWPQQQITDALNQSYNYDNVGNVQDITDSRPNMNQAFQYDDLDRLTSITGTTHGLAQYSYDRQGNRQTIGSTSYGYDPGTWRLTSHNGHLFGYDANGNTLTAADTTMTYTPHNMVSSFTKPGTTAAYEYDGDDLRKVRTVNGVTNYYVHGLGTKLLTELKDVPGGAPSITRDYIYIGQRLIAQLDPPAGTSTPTEAAAVELDVVAQQAVEGTQATVRAILRRTGTGAMPSSVVVRVVTQNGSAQAGTDYTAQNAVLTFPASAVSGDSQVIVVALPDDTTGEGNESFTVSLTVDPQPVTFAVAGARALQTVTIVDNEAPVPTISLSADVSVAENVASHEVVLTATLNTPTSQQVSVQWAAAATSGPACSRYDALSGTLVFPANTTQMTIRIPIRDNLRANEGATTFAVTLSAPVNAGINRGQALVTIQDDEAPIAIDMSLPGRMLADVRGPDRDYVAIANPWSQSISATWTLVFADGSARRQTETFAPKERRTIDLGLFDAGCRTGASIAVQVPAGAPLPTVEHAGYWGEDGGVSTEGRIATGQVYFAEGGTGFAKETIAVFNPNPFDAVVSLSFYTSAGLTAPTSRVVKAMSRTVWDVNAAVPATEHGTIVTAVQAIGGQPSATPAPVVASRLMKAEPGLGWSAGHDGHSSSGLQGGYTTAYLAEGHKNDATLRTYVAIVNLGAQATTIRLTYNHENGGVVTRDVSVAAQSRITEVPPAELPSGSYGMTLTSGINGTPAMPIMAERMMYGLSQGALRSGNVGVAQPLSGVRSFAEGITGYYSSYFLIHNPALSPANVKLDFFNEYGVKVGTNSAFVPAHGRITVDVNSTPAMANQVFQTIVSSSLPVYSERVSYWPRDSATVPFWAASHLSNGSQLAATYRGPYLSFSTSTATVTEGTGGSAAVFSPVVNVRTADGGALTEPLVVYYSAGTASGVPATPGTDFVNFGPRQAFTIPAGTPHNANVALSGIAIGGDVNDEFNETFRVVLVDADNGMIDGQTTLDVTIADDDAPPVTSVTASSPVSEGAGLVTFTVTLSPVSQKTVTVNFASSNGTAAAGFDYQYRSGSLTFTPGQTSQQIQVTLINDTGVEPSETFHMDLSAPSNATLGTSRATATIQDNERPRFEINPSLPSIYFPDLTAAPTTSSYVMIFNPHPVAITARLTYTRRDGSGKVRDLTVPAQQRVTVDLYTEAEISGEGDVSLVVQSLDSMARALVADASNYWDGDWRGGRTSRGATPNPVWYFAEGGTSGFFDEYFTIYNPSNQPAMVRFQPYTPSGAGAQFTALIPEGPGRVKVRINNQLPNSEHGMAVYGRTMADAPLPVVVERTMFWDTTDHREGHSSTGTSVLGTVAYFAEGFTPFSPYLLVVNPNASTLNIQVRYLHDNGGTYTQDASVIPFGRISLPMPASVPAGGYATEVVSTNGVTFTAERSTYFGTNWKAGDSSVGSLVTATRWLFAEGSVGFFHTYITMVNPTTTPANVTVTFRMESGAVSTHYVTVPARGRASVDVNSLSLPWASFATDVQVTNGVPIVAERVSYWPDPNWHGVHISRGRPQ